MKKFISISVAAIGLVASQAASAQTFATTPGTYTYFGSGVVVQKGSGPQLICDLGFDIVNNGSTITASNPILTGSGGFCDTVVFVNTPYNVTVSGSTVTFEDVFADTTITPGDCAGDLVATYGSGPPENLSINDTLEEVDANTGDCTINGVIEQVFP